MIGRIKDVEYVAPKNEKWRHDNSDSDNKDTKMSEMIEKKTRWWCVRDGKQKRTPKSSPAVSIPKDGDKRIVKGGALKQLDRSSGAPQQRLVDEIVLEPVVVIKQGVSILSQSFENYLKRNKEAAAQKAQGSTIQDKDQESSSDDSEATQSESELDPTTLGRGKAQLKKKPLKKKKTSDDEDRSYEPDESIRKKRKAVQAGFIPRNVRAKKSAAASSKGKEGKKDKHIQKEKVRESEKTPSVELPKEPEVQSVDEPVAEAGKGTGDDDYV
ncbi:hypothetical protein Hdeb2414_s0003g00102521 [Helianthus debilis subsp. tardiflorus]